MNEGKKMFWQNMFVQCLGRKNELKAALGLMDYFS